jgi:orotidine-5'-phosphate decarboxylase
MYGAAGLKAFEETLKYAAEKGLVVIADAKRNDIGSTMEAYATAHLGEIELYGKKVSPFGADALTVNGYLGTDGVKPLLPICKEKDKGIFVLVKTSNPSSGELQDRKMYNKKGAPSGTVYEVMGEMCEEWGKEAPGSKYGYSSVGAVVGATYPEQLSELRGKLPHTFFLVPGYGAQGGGGAGVAGAFDANGLGAIVNASRSIICAYKKEGCDETDYAGAARREAIRMREDICQYINLK